MVAECVDVDSPAQLPCHASALRALILMSATTASFEFETPVGRFQAARRSAFTGRPRIHGPPWKLLVGVGVEFGMVHGEVLQAFIFDRLLSVTLPRSLVRRDAVNHHQILDVEIRKVRIALNSISHRAESSLALL